MTKFLRKLDKRHMKHKKSPWIKPKERFIASPSKRLTPSNCPKSFLVTPDQPINSATEPVADTIGEQEGEDTPMHSEYSDDECVSSDIDSCLFD